MTYNQKRLDTYSTHLKVNITGENRENRVSIRNDVIIGNYNGYLKFNINNRDNNTGKAIVTRWHGKNGG